MKVYLAELARGSRDSLEGRNRVREALQAKLLTSLQRSGGMIPLAFQGGTALRFLFSIGRYSEDLDFALERPDKGYDFRAYLRDAAAALVREGYQVDLRVNDRKTVHSAFVRFPGLLFELDLSPHRKEVLAVKIEVDTRPPAGAVLETTVVRRHEILQLQHHDRASLLAGKLHAILQRPYVKGRDLYDLVWYLGDRSWPEPNLALLKNALRQTQWEGGPVSEGTWRATVLERLQDVDWKKALADVEPFIESPSEMSHLTLETVSRLLA